MRRRNSACECEVNKTLHFDNATVSIKSSEAELTQNPSFVLSLNLSSVFKFNLSRAKQSLPKISTKFLSVRPSVRLSVCLSVCPENQTLFRWRNFFGGNRKTHHNKHDTMIAPAGGERSEPTAGARGVGELKRIPYPKKLDEEEKFCM